MYTAIVTRYHRHHHQLDHGFCRSHHQQRYHRHPVQGCGGPRYLTYILPIRDLYIWLETPCFSPEVSPIPYVYPMDRPEGPPYPVFGVFRGILGVVHGVSVSLTRARAYNDLHNHPEMSEFTKTSIKYGGRGGGQGSVLGPIPG